MKIQWSAWLLILLMGILTGSCIVFRLKVNKGNPEYLQEFDTKTSARAHLTDGSVILMKDGFTVISDNGTTWVHPNVQGVKYNLTRDSSSNVVRFSQDEILAIEYYENKFDYATLIYSIPAWAITGIGVYKMIYGSCPTFYSYNGQDYLLEAEGFSYSISKRFESEDLDKLEGGIVQNGKYRLLMRNEALETHYLNHMDLLEVTHDSSYEAFSTIGKGTFPNKKRSVLLVGDIHPPENAVNRRGDDVLEKIKQRDQDFYQTNSTDKQETEDGYMDWIEFKVIPPTVQEKAFLVIKIRNTLLNNMLFYNHFLNRQNYHSVDWMGKKLEDRFYAFKLFNWYRQYFGMKIEMLQDDQFVEINRFGDSGPLAWNTLSFPIELTGEESVSMRLKFLPDNWMVDWIGIGYQGSDQVNVITHTPTVLKKPDEVKNNYISRQLADTDKEYLMTYPGHNYLFEYDVDPLENGMKRSFFISSTGYYSEWIRQSWLKPAEEEDFRNELALNPDLIRALRQDWEESNLQFQDMFFTNRITLDPDEY